MSRSRMGPRPPGGSQVKVAEAPLPDLFHMLVDGVTDYAIVLLDAEGRVLTWNVGAERMTGYRAEEAIGRPISHFYPREEVASGHVERELARAAGEGRAEDESWRTRKDGTRFWANTVLTAIREPSGELRGYSRVTRDLTDRHRSEVFYHSVIDHTLDAIVSMNERGEIESMNRSAERMFGYSEREVLGRSFTTLLPEEYRSRDAATLLNDLRKGDRTSSGEGRVTYGHRKDNTEFPLDIAVTDFQFEGRRHFTGILRDVTDRQHLEHQLWQAQKMEAVGQLAG